MSDALLFVIVVVGALLLMFLLLIVLEALHVRKPGTIIFVALILYFVLANQIRPGLMQSTVEFIIRSVLPSADADFILQK